jgi:glyoxylase-like metal-dependent hydrolase (beta-lactamase superfamily II)
MRKLTPLAVGFVLALTLAGCSQNAGTVQGAAEALGATDLNSIEYSGTGRWYQFGQAPNPTLPWPQFDVSAYTASIDYQAPAARVQMTRKQTVEPGRVRPAPVEQRPDLYVNTTYAWNLTAPAGSAPGTPPMAQPQPAAVEERTMEIWSTPHGFLKAALGNNATSEAEATGSEVTFTAGKNRYVGTINGQNQVERIQTWIDNPVLGDTLVETTFSDYRDFGGVMFPGRIMRSQGGHPVLDLTVSEVRANAPVDATVPDAVRNFTPPAITVDVEKLADGVYYLKGGSHHSLAIEQTDHIVVFEAPQTEDRSNAVIAKVKETIPNKPIRYVINSHVHFDHSGGLRTYVDEGATIVTHAMNRPYYEQAWAAPRTLNPDRLAKSGKTATFETVTGKHVLTDGKRTIEVHEIAGNGHNDGFVMVYLPAERIVSEADVWNAPLPNAPPPATVNPYTVNFHENIQRLKLPVRVIAPLHGPGTGTLAQLRSAAMPATATN